MLEDNFVFNELPGQIHLVLGNVGGILYVAHYQDRVGADPLQILPQGRNLIMTESCKRQQLYFANVIYWQVFVKSSKTVQLHDGVSEDPALDHSRVSQDHGSQPASVVGSQHPHPPLADEGEFLQNIPEVSRSEGWEVAVRSLLT